MNYTLMHKNIPVMDIDIDKEFATITKIGEIYDMRRIPLGVNTAKGDISRRELSDWLKGRSIPASRLGIDALYEKLGIKSTDRLIFECHGLSLSDHYWVRPINMDADWHDVNFFENDFSSDVGKMLFGQNPDNPEQISLMSPDNTTEGWLRKKWITSDGARKLVKSGAAPFYQEPYNEVIASSIMRRLKIPHVRYDLLCADGETLCGCDNFLDTETEFISAAKIIDVRKMNNSDSKLTHLLLCCETVGIPDIRHEINQMMTLDYIIANRDRHYNNFGFVRNADTLEWVRFAPVFDSGTSLWNSTVAVGSEPKKNEPRCKPFRNDQEKQFGLVSDLEWFDAKGLDGIGNEIKDIFSGSDSIDEQRYDALAWQVERRSKNVSQKKLELHKTSLFKTIEFPNMEKIADCTGEDECGNKIETPICPVCQGSGCIACGGIA